MAKLSILDPATLRIGTQKQHGKYHDQKRVKEKKNA